MSGALQAVFQNQRSFVPPPPSVIGQAYGGGYYAGQISTAGNSVADFYLIVGPVASAQTNKQYKTSNTSDSGASSVIDGPANSTALNDASHPAAQFCKGLTVGGYTDWYMPAQNELEVCYYNLKPDTTSNVTSSGINTNAVPSRSSAYTAGTPAQTSAAIFQTGGSQAFSSVYYWTSTQRDAYRGFQQSFSNGTQSFASKSNYINVRAIRRIAV